MSSQVKILRSAGYYASAKFPMLSFQMNLLLENIIEDINAPVEFYEGEAEYPEYDDRFSGGFSD